MRRDEEAKEVYRGRSGLEIGNDIGFDSPISRNAFRPKCMKVNKRGQWPSKTEGRRKAANRCIISDYATLTFGEKRSRKPLN